MRSSALRTFSVEFAHDNRTYPWPRAPKSGPPMMATPASSSSMDASALAIRKPAFRPDMRSVAGRRIGAWSCGVAAEQRSAIREGVLPSLFGCACGCQCAVARAVDQCRQAPAGRKRRGTARASPFGQRPPKGARIGVQPIADEESRALCSRAGGPGHDRRGD